MFEFIQSTPLRRTLRARDHVTRRVRRFKLLWRMRFVDAYKVLVFAARVFFFVVFFSNYVVCRFFGLFFFIRIKFGVLSLPSS